MSKIKVSKENIHDLIEDWHTNESSKELHEYLGLSWEQYANWVETDELPSI